MNEATTTLTRADLVIRRAAHNESIRNAYTIATDIGKSSVAIQEQFFYQAFPDQVDVGPNKSTTLDWLLSRTRDGTKTNAPRELVHLLNNLRDVQVRRFELGAEPKPEDNQLFARVAFKEALPEVSKVRLEQTLYAEHPDQKLWLEKLKGEKTLQTLDTLAQIWAVPIDEATARAAALANIGFFEQRGSKQAGPETEGQEKAGRVEQSVRPDGELAEASKVQLVEDRMHVRPRAGGRLPAAVPLSGRGRAPTG